MGKIYVYEKAKRAANHATATERHQWNRHIDHMKMDQAARSHLTFVPRKASHKQGWRRAEVQLS